MFSREICVFFFSHNTQLVGLLSLWKSGGDFTAITRCLWAAWSWIFSTVSKKKKPPSLVLQHKNIDYPSWAQGQQSEISAGSGVWGCVNKICRIPPGNPGTFRRHQQRLPRCSHTLFRLFHLPDDKKTKKNPTNPQICAKARCIYSCYWVLLWRMEMHLLSQHVPYVAGIRRWCSRAFRDLSINSSEQQMICLALFIYPKPR